MKRLIFLCMTVLVAVAVNAQCYLGGTLGISAVRTSVDGDAETATTLNVVPEFGYNINKIFTVGTSVGISYASSGTDVTTLSISPFGRATFAHVKIVDFFADLVFSYEHGWVEGFSTDGFGIGLCPGLKIKVSDKIDLLAKTTLLQYSSQEDVKVTGYSLCGSFSFGMAYNF